MQHRRGVEVLDGEWCSNTCSGRFTPRKISGTNCTESWLESKASRVRKKEGKISCCHLHWKRPSNLYQFVTSTRLSQHLLGNTRFEFCPRNVVYLAWQFPHIPQTAYRNCELETFNRLLPPHIMNRTLFSAWRTNWEQIRGNIHLLQNLSNILLSLKFVFNILLLQTYCFHLMFERNVLKYWNFKSNRKDIVNHHCKFWWFTVSVLNPAHLLYTVIIFLNIMGWMKLPLCFIISTFPVFC